MDKEIRLGRFDKWGYKNSFSKGELARELTYMNRDYDKLEQQCKKQKETIDKAIDIAYEYGQIDGGHHKMWVIDQMVRTLLKDDYDKFVKEYEEPDKNDDYYEWDTGIAP